ncbi:MULTISPECIES: DinB family protein [unclassified Mycobacterium]|uniref:DinB family protein n=1 Tax=unclassified Mycobacterium TaxID=2642494 RepID=UPI0029C6A91E|nr:MULTISPECIES: DinB family protein [unclassified Mycobacterium]
MTDSARHGSRRDARPPRTGVAEEDVLVGFLDYLRACVIEKVRGVPEPLVRTPGVPSGTNLLGLLKHLAHVERYTFLGETVTDWPATFHAGPDETVDLLVDAYREAIAQANRVITACGDLESASARPTKGMDAPSMRWALVHMIEETGRHAGHLDILRELADGTTGR